MHTLAQDLREIFGPRLASLAVYRAASDAADAPTPSIATVDTLTSDDLRACASRVARWHDLDLATPLIIPSREFARALDAFPLEFAAILADHTLVVGADPFAGLAVDVADLRRACEVQARSHLLHLRQGSIEARGRSDAIADLLADSTEPLAGLVKSVARLVGTPARESADAARVVETAAGLSAGSLGAIFARTRGRANDDARTLLPVYLDAVERLTHFVDGWGRA